MRYHLVARTGHPDFLDLPWDVPLAEWDVDRIVEVPTGVHRHVVRAVAYDDAHYFVKELPDRYASREYRFLRQLKQEDVPVVDVAGVVRQRYDRDGEPLSGVLITRQLEYSLPYRLLFLRRDATELRDPMLDALVDLLVRIHLTGFAWGDCSLSNTLFRRDAGRLAAYLVDTETGEMHPSGLTDGQRDYDVELAQERCAGELLDLVAAGVVGADVDVVGIAEELRDRYEVLWDELTSEEEFGVDERYRIHERLRRINDLGYDVEELEVDAAHEGEQGHRLRLSTLVVEPGHNRRRLMRLTGLEAQEQQARTLLHDLAGYGLWLRESEGVPYSETYVARRWLEESFGRALDIVPRDLRGKRDAAEIFTEALEYWWDRCIETGEDLDLFETTQEYVDEVLRHVPDERVAAATDEESAVAYGDPV